MTRSFHLTRKKPRHYCQRNGSCAFMAQEEARSLPDSCTDNTQAEAYSQSTQDNLETKDFPTNKSFNTSPPLLNLPAKEHKFLQTHHMKLKGIKHFVTTFKILTCCQTPLILLTQIAASLAAIARPRGSLPLAITLGLTCTESVRFSPVSGTGPPPPNRLEMVLPSSVDGRQKNPEYCVSKGGRK